MASDTTIAVQAAPPGPLLGFWRAFRENRGAVIRANAIVPREETGKAAQDSRKLAEEA